MMNFIKQELFSAQTNGKIYSKMKCVWSSNQDKPSIFLYFFFLLQRKVLLVKKLCCNWVVKVGDTWSVNFIAKPRYLIYWPGVIPNPVTTWLCNKLHWWPHMIYLRQILTKIKLHKIVFGLRSRLLIWCRQDVRSIYIVFMWLTSANQS